MVLDREVVTTDVSDIMAYQIAPFSMTSTVNHPMQIFLTVVFHTCVQQFTTFQLTYSVARYLCDTSVLGVIMQVGIFHVINEMEA